MPRWPRQRLATKRPTIEDLHRFSLKGCGATILRLAKARFFLQAKNVVGKQVI